MQFPRIFRLERIWKPDTVRLIRLQSLHLWLPLGCFGVDSVKEVYRWCYIDSFMEMSWTLVEYLLPETCQVLNMFLFFWTNKSPYLLMNVQSEYYREVKILCEAFIGHTLLSCKQFLSNAGVIQNTIIPDIMPFTNGNKDGPRDCDNWVK